MKFTIAVFLVAIILSAMAHTVVAQVTGAAADKPGLSSTTHIEVGMALQIALSVGSLFGSALGCYWIVRMLLVKVSAAVDTLCQVNKRDHDEYERRLLLVEKREQECMERQLAERRGPDRTSVPTQKE